MPTPSPQQNLSAAQGFRREGKPDAAVKAALAALKEDPHLAGAWECAAAIYLQHGQWAAARGLLESAVKFVPGAPALEAYYALALAETGDVAQGFARIEAALRQNPTHAEMLFAKADILCTAGHYDRAIAAFAEAEKHGARKAAAFGAAGARFITGDFAALPGLAALEDDAPDAPPLPLWDGKPAKHVVLYGSQGFGDILMFLRYLTRAKPAEKVTLRIPYQLMPLVRGSFPDLPLIATRDPGDTNDMRLPPGVGTTLPPDADARCPLIRLAAMGDFDARAGDVPYLRADETKIAAWKERLAALPSPRIGLVWSGSQRNRVDHHRSVPFEALQPLIAEFGPHLVSLQMGPEQAHAATAAIFDATPFIRDFADSAALLGELDLLITVDTAAAHLAGALGRPTWTFIPFARTDWRWLLGREDTLWYPTMRLFRQAAPGGWGEVVERIGADLRRLVAN